MENCSVPHVRCSTELFFSKVALRNFVRLRRRAETIAADAPRAAIDQGGSRSTYKLAASVGPPSERPPDEDFEDMPDTSIAGSPCRISPFSDATMGPIVRSAHST